MRFYPHLGPASPVLPGSGGSSAFWEQCIHIRTVPFTSPHSRRAVASCCPRWAELRCHKRLFFSGLCWSSFGGERSPAEGSSTRRLPSEKCPRARHFTHDRCSGWTGRGMCEWTSGFSPDVQSLLPRGDSEKRLRLSCFSIIFWCRCPLELLSDLQLHLSNTWCTTVSCFSSEAAEERLKHPESVSCFSVTHNTMSTVTWSLSPNRTSCSSSTC